MKNYNGGKPELENLSQGFRVEYIRKLRYISKNDVAYYFDLGVERKKGLLADMKIIVEYLIMKD